MPCRRRSAGTSGRIIRPAGAGSAQRRRAPDARGAGDDGALERVDGQRVHAVRGGVAALAAAVGERGSAGVPAAREHRARAAAAVVDHRVRADRARRTAAGGHVRDVELRRPEDRVDDAGDEREELLESIRLSHQGRRRAAQQMRLLCVVLLRSHTSHPGMYEVGNERSINKCPFPTSYLQSSIYLLNNTLVSKDSTKS